ncbi:MAG: hypothetical protein DLM56_02680 [Pseudonocardiales bacterium]|nr:MAG: hypothetical protein DLM56_02680 [Pseudonocardiales bacterium]
MTGRIDSEAGTGTGVGGVAGAAVVGAVVVVGPVVVVVAGAAPVDVAVLPVGVVCALCDVAEQPAISAATLTAPTTPTRKRARAPGITVMPRNLIDDPLGRPHARAATAAGPTAAHSDTL